MNRLKMKLLPLLATFLLGSLTPVVSSSATDASGAAKDADIVFSAGRKGGGYWGVAERMQRVGSESGLTVEIRESVGSLQNLARLADPDSPVNLTLTQADALKSYLKEHPGFGNRIDILESIGLECVFIIAASASDLENDQDLQDPKGHIIAIPGAQSGVAVTFDYMSELVPGLSNTQPVYREPMEAMLQLGAAGEADAIMLVHRPKVQTAEIRLALDQPDKYKLIPVEDRHLADRLPSGESVYEFLDVPLTRTGMNVDRSVPTICTKGLLLSSPRKLDKDAKKRLDKIIDFQWMRIYPTDP